MPPVTPADAALVLDHVLGDPVYTFGTVDALLAALPKPSAVTPRLRRAVLLRSLIADPLSQSSLEALRLLASLPASASASASLIAKAHITVAAFLAASAPDFDAAARDLFARPDGTARRAVDGRGAPALASVDSMATVDRFEAAIGDSSSQTLLRGVWGNRATAEALVIDLVVADWAVIEPSMLESAAHRIAGDGAVETWRAADEATRAQFRILVGEKRTREILSKLEEPTSSANPISTPAVEKVIDSLKRSSAGLHSVVDDPLPAAKTVANELLAARMEKAVRSNAEVRGQPTTCAPAGPSALNETDKGPSTGKPHKVWNPTALTFQWEESPGPEISESSSLPRPHLPSPRRVPVSPLPIGENKNGRRRPRKWCSLEEETLRKGVEQYGSSNWKDILNNYPDVFIGRKPVDLKDKWRNMIKR